MMDYDTLEELYREVILDHYRSPRNQRDLDRPDVTVEGANPLCDDLLTLQLTIQGVRILDAGFHGKGCSISQPSTSMMTV